MGKGVGVQNSPVSSSRTYSASPGGSQTGSFVHGVRRFSRLLTDHVHPEPDSDTRQPKLELARTLIQGAGVCCSPRRRIRYSCPSAVKPPRPLKNSSSPASSGGFGEAPFRRRDRD